MSKPEKMSKIRIVVANQQLKKVIDKLYELTVLHIISHNKDNELDISSPLENNAKIAEILVKAKAVMANYNIKEIKSAKESKITTEFLERTEKKITDIINRLAQKDNEIHELEAQLQHKTELFQQIEVLNSLYLNLESYDKLQSIATFVGYIKHDEELKEKITAITTKHKIHLSRNGKNRTVALFIEKDKEKEAAEILKQYNFESLKMDLINGLKGSSVLHSTRVHKEVAAIEHEIHQLQRDCKEIISEEAHYISSTVTILEIESKKTEIPLHFAKTQDTTIISGWVPAKLLQHINCEIEDITNNSIIIETLEQEKKDKIPIKLKNARLIKPFEFFLRLYTLPNYKEIDPSFLLFITFPIFFGIMLGDIGYGITTALLFYYLKKKMPSAKDLLNVMIIASIISIAFGFVFGEFFGFEYVSEQTGETLINLGLPLHKEMIENEVVYSFPRLINRLHGEVHLLGYDIHIVLLLGVIIGIIHLNLALLIGFLNELHHGIFAAITEKLSWMLFQVGIFLLIAPMINLFYIPSYISIGIIILSIILIYKGEGVRGLVELPAVFSTILSYLRLGAVGLASVGLAVVINENLAHPFLEKGGIYIAIAILIMILGHAINIALGIIGPFLHSLRLHYVEFFSRFYKGGGISYKPFGKIEE
ncbi:hypothetical protein J4232_01685 [Candidatus Woesearchaeota archaeon]|nr:hypothetical protein [Candidatus Woesearchaeota archaeon]